VRESESESEGFLAVPRNVRDAPEPQRGWETTALKLVLALVLVLALRFGGASVGGDRCDCRVALDPWVRVEEQQRREGDHGFGSIQFGLVRFGSVRFPASHRIVKQEVIDE